jgi:uncharacterized protein (TIGR02421 family)
MGNRICNRHFAASMRIIWQKKIRALSDRLLQAQRPIRVLPAIKWNEDIERAFFAAKERSLPPITSDYYRSRPLSFDPDSKIEELKALERDVSQQLGVIDPPGAILVRMCEEYRSIVRMLACRGTPDFASLSAKLYGSGSDLGLTSQSWKCLTAIPQHAIHKHERKTLDAKQAADFLARRLQAHFDGAAIIRVRPSDHILADASAGRHCVKLRGDVRFSMRDLRLLEAHEGWVHLGTTLNGQGQPVCTFLEKGPPSTTATQEGLAVSAELLSDSSSPQRIQRLWHRMEAVSRAEDGADFRDIYRFFLERGYEARHSYHCTVRVFRGSLPAGCGPFTKDLSYCKGLVLIADFLRRALRQNAERKINLLFCGKTTLADLPALEHLRDEGLLTPPRFIPPPFVDSSALVAWLGSFESLVSARSRVEINPIKLTRKAV